MTLNRLFKLKRSFPSPSSLKETLFIKNKYNPLLVSTVTCYSISRRVSTLARFACPGGAFHQVPLINRGVSRSVRCAFGNSFCNRDARTHQPELHIMHYKIYKTNEREVSCIFLYTQLHKADARSRSHVSNPAAIDYVQEVSGHGFHG